MPAGIVLASDRVEPRAVAETVGELDPGVDDVTVVCDADRRDAVAAAVDARTITDRVPDGGSVAAMRAGLRTTGTATAVVTTPEAPSLDPSVAVELAPTADAEAVLAEFDGDRYPPLGGYEVGPTVAACDVTLATGSRRFDDVLARLSVATQSLSVPGEAPDTRARHEG